MVFDTIVGQMAQKSFAISRDKNANDNIFSDEHDLINIPIMYRSYVVISLTTKTLLLLFCAFEEEKHEISSHSSISAIILRFRFICLQLK